MNEPDGSGLTEFIAGRMAGAEIYRLLGLRVVAAEHGRVHLELGCDARHANVDGVVHGGILCLLADTAMGFAVRTQLEPDWLNRTLHMSMDWTGGATPGDLLSIDAKVEQATQRLRWASAEIVNDEGLVVGLARSLNSVRPPG